MDAAAHRQTSRRRGFTLLELILSVAVLVVVIALLVQVMSSVQRVWRGGASDAALTRAAAAALDLVAADLAAAARGPLPGEESASASSEEEEMDDAKRDVSAPLLVVRHTGPEAPLPAETPAPEDLDSGQELCFSRVAVLARAPRPVWTDDETTLRPRRRPVNESDLRLRALLRVRYDVVPREDSATDEATTDAAASGLCHDLVRRVAGIRADDTEDPFRGWWEADEAPEDFGAAEVLARNVVWFDVTVPDFLGVATNRTEAAEGGLHVWGNYATVTRTEGSGSSGAEPLPPLVDVVLGIVSDETLSRAEAQSDEKRRAAILRQGLRVYTRRILLR